MDHLIELPPKKNPKKLTARHKPRQLHEFFLGFLNTNNAAGFKNDEWSSGQDNTIDVNSIPEISTSEYPVIRELLFEAGQRTSISERELKDYAKK